MKYLMLVLSLISCSYSYSQSQVPDLVIPIQFTFQLGGGPIIMQVGLDSIATDCLDLQIGESELPPIPPPGWEAVIYLPYPQCQGSFGDPIMAHKDFRFGELPFTGTKTHKFRFRPDLGVTIHWNFPNGLTGLLQDELTGGGIINHHMSGQDSFYVQYNFIDEINMILNYDNMIPVELTSFTGLILQNEKVIQLNWTTATENNNSGFNVERKRVNTDWEEIGFVPGYGTTTETHSYSYNDAGLNSGTYTYRLKQMDFDGSFIYSNEIEVEVDFTPKEFVLHQNYPNPFNPTTTIDYAIKSTGLVSLKVYDMLGTEIASLVNEVKEAGNYSVTFNAAELPSGIYFYTLTAGNFTATKKLILLK